MVRNNKKSAIDRDTYVGGKQASEILGVHQRTLYNWEKKGLIETIRMPGGKRLYNVKKFIKEKQLTFETKKDNENNINSEDFENMKELRIIYARVSSLGQKNDLERQKIELKKKYPNHHLIQDIGSGVNLNRRGLRKIINLAIEGKVKELVVVHKDRLTRFGYELIEDIIKDYSDGKIIIINQEQDIEPEEELVKDVLTIMNVFVAKMNGMRKYNKNKNK